MAQLAGTQTETNLRQAFTHESKANRRFLYFAEQADSEGLTDVASLFRSLAEVEAGHASGHLALLEDSDKADQSDSVSRSRDNLARSIKDETAEAERFYPDLARQAREDGFAEIAEWFDTLAAAEGRHAVKLRETLASLG